MYYDEKTARALIIEAGHRLLENKLVARTWGNLSARISEDAFIITPSGRAYDTLAPEDLVKVCIRDLSYEGDRKPSSEKGIHAQAYLLRPDCSFIIDDGRIANLANRTDRVLREAHNLEKMYLNGAFADV